MQSQALFIGNVAAHLVALMTGIASLVLATVSAIKKKPVMEKWFWVAAALCLFAAFDGAWQDEHRNTQKVIEEKAVATSIANSCQQDERTNSAYAKGLEGLNGNQRQTIDAQQRLIDSQQKDVSSCVVSLGKMNPVVHREVRVIVMPIRTANSPSGTITDSEVVITTNQQEHLASGNLSCDDDFEINSLPSLATVTGNGFIGGVAPAKINNREYWISFQTAYSQWGPNTPILLSIRQKTERRPSCIFTP